MGDLTEAELDGAATRLAAAAAHERSDLIRPTAILALLAVGRSDEARGLVGDGPRLQPCWTWEFNLVQWADITVQLSLTGAEQIRRQLEPYADDLVVAGSNLAAFGWVHRRLARLADHLGDAESARVHDARAEERQRDLEAGLDGCGLGPEGAAL